MSKHTPGPWEAVNGPEDTYYVEECGQRGIVAEVLHICTDEWTDANASLIAAAPDLLAALRDLVDDCESANGCMGNEHKIDTDEARAAIAKAEGK